MPSHLDSSRTPRALARVLLGAPLVAAALLAVLGAQTVLGDGSGNLESNGGKRALTEWRTSLYGNLLPRRTLFKVYAKAGDELALGSSGVGVGSGDIVVWVPGHITAPLTVSLPAPDFSCKASQPGKGQMTTRLQEQSGPTPALNGYTPCTYTVAATGVYNVALYGPSGPNSDTDGSAGTIAAPTVDATQNSGVSLWDISVRDAASPASIVTGRVFTDYLAQLTGGNGAANRVNSTLYAVTRDGFKYQVDLRGLDPNGFIIYGNTVGFLNPDGTTPLYHDLNDGVNNQLLAPQGGVTLSPPTGLLFFGSPAADLPASIVPTPIVPSVSSITFQGTAGTVDGSGGSVYSTGGTITFDGNVGGIAQVVITPNVAPGGATGCANADYNPDLPTNRVVRSEIPSGVQLLHWDGKDNTGAYMPTSWSGNGGIGYCFEATLHAGEYHFPLLDAENSMLGGPTLTLLNPPGGTCPLATCRTAFFDDRGYRTSSGATVGTVGSVLPGTNPPPAPYHSSTGFDTASTVIRAYGNDSSTGFGDKKGLDLWTYFPSSNVVGQLFVVPQSTTDLAITKTHTGDFSIGVPATYTITVRSVGTNAVPGLITVTDPVPAGLTLVSAAGTGWSCGTAGQLATCTVTPGGAGLASGASLPPITVTVNPTLAAAPRVTNTATVANASDANPANDSSSTTADITNADLAVSKTANGLASAPVGEGGTVTYSVTATNNGPSDASGVAVADTLPAGLTLDSASASQGAWDGATWSVGTLANGASATLTITATVNAGQGGATIHNAATVSGGPGDPIPGNDSSTADVVVPRPTADLSITKTDGTTTVDAGATTTYTISVRNGGPSSVTGAVLADPVAPGLHVTGVACSPTPGQCAVAPSPAELASGTFALPTLAANASYEILVTADVTATSGNVTNTASVTPPAGVDDPNPGDNTATDVDTVTPVADLSVTKTDSPDPVAVLGTLTYTLAVSNAGPSDAVNLTVSDPLPAGVTYASSSGTGWSCGVAAGTVTCTRPSLAVGAAPDITIIATVDAATSDPLSNTATVSSDTHDPNPGDNTSTATTAVQAAAPAITIVKHAALDRTVVAPTDRPDAGDAITYTFDVTNSGNVPLTGVTVSDPAVGLASCVIGSLGIGATDSTTCTASHTLTQSDIDAGSYANSASATGKPPTGPDVTDTGSVTTPLAASPALTLSKRVSASADGPWTASIALAAPATVYYRLVATNTGNVTVDAVSITDPLLDTLDCTPTAPTALAPGGHLTCNGSHAVSPAEFAAAPLVNTANAAGTFGGNPVDAAPASATVTATSTAHLTLAKSASASVDGPWTATVTLADPAVVYYRLVVTNDGNITVTGVAVDDPLLGAVACDWSDKTEGTLLAGDSVTCTGSHAVTSGELAAGPLVNTATASGQSAAGAVESEAATATVIATGTPHLSLTKTSGSASFNQAGDVVVFTIVATNDGTATIQGVRVTDPMVPSLSCTPHAPATLAPGHRMVCTGRYTATASDVAAGQIRNVARATGTGVGSVSAVAVVLGVPPTDASAPTDPGYALFLLLPLLGALIGMAMLVASELDRRARQKARRS